MLIWLVASHLATDSWTHKLTSSGAFRRVGDHAVDHSSGACSAQAKDQVQGRKYRFHPGRKLEHAEYQVQQRRIVAELDVLDDFYE